MVGATKGVQVLLEVGTAGQLQLITALLSLAARVELHRQIKSPGDVHLVLKQWRKWSKLEQNICFSTETLHRIVAEWGAVWGLKGTVQGRTGGV